MTHKRDTRNGHASDLPKPPDGVDEPPGPDGDAAAEVTLRGAGKDLPMGDAEVGNTLQTYLREIRKAPLLTPEEEYDTAVKARAGDFPARQAMIERNLRLVGRRAESGCEETDRFARNRRLPRCNRPSVGMSSDRK